MKIVPFRLPAPQPDSTADPRCRTCRGTGLQRCVSRRRVVTEIRCPDCRGTGRKP